MKTLQFANNEISKTRFALLYQAFLFGTPEGGIKGLDAHRRAVRILDKIEVISEAVETDTDEGRKTSTYPTGDAVRKLRSEDCELTLDDLEYEMLKSHFEAILPRLSVSSSREVVDCGDFLNGV